MLHTQTGKNCCARMIVPPVAGRACSEQDLTYGQVLFILSQPARTHMWHVLTRFSSAWVCNIRVNLARKDNFGFLTKIDDVESKSADSATGFLKLFSRFSIRNLQSSNPV
jgi:hypothetical protein